jgi:hypothetical protein
VFLQLALDLVFDLFEKVALDANAAAMQLPRTAGRKQGVVASQGALGALVGVVRVDLKLGLEIHAECRSVSNRRMLLPDEAKAGLIGLGRLVEILLLIRRQYVVLRRLVLLLFWLLGLRARLGWAGTL